MRSHSLDRQVARPEVLLVLCRDVEQANQLVVDNAAPALRAMGAHFVSGGWQLENGKRVEFHSVRNPALWSRLHPRAVHGLAIWPLYRHDPYLTPALTERVDQLLDLLVSQGKAQILGDLRTFLPMGTVESLPPEPGSVAGGRGHWPRWPFGRGRPT